MYNVHEYYYYLYNPPFLTLEKPYTTDFTLGAPQDTHKFYAICMRCSLCNEIWELKLTTGVLALYLLKNVPGFYYIHFGEPYWRLIRSVASFSWAKIDTNICRGLDIR